MELRSAIRSTAISVAGSMKSTATEPRVIVLLYHSIHESAPYASASPLLFGAHLEWLAANFHIVDYPSIVDGTAEIPEGKPAVAITFDDGFEDNHRHVLPMLDRNGIRATFFLTTGLIDDDSRTRDRFARLLTVNREDITGMNWSQVAELRDSGMDIGAHTVTHPNLAVLSDVELATEIMHSREILENRLGIPIEHFAYPFGKPKHNVNDAVVSRVKESGFTSGATVLYRPISETDLPYRVPRFSITGDDISSLATKMEGGWDVLGLWQERAPRRLSAAVSPGRTFSTEYSLDQSTKVAAESVTERARRQPGRSIQGRIAIWPPFPTAALTSPGRPKDALPFPLDQEGARIYRRARQGLWHGVRSLGLGAGDDILTPSYHQGSEIEAFVKADLSPVYYELDERLEPSQRDLERLLSPATKALHLIHFWGMPQDSARWRRWCDERGIFLIEDGAQAFLAETPEGPVGSLGDLAVFCLYKSFGLPDGAVAICKNALPDPTTSTGSGAATMSKRVLSAIAQRSPWLASAHRAISSGESRRAFGEFLSGELELGDPYAAPSRLTALFLNRVIDASAASTRRSNYLALSRNLGDLMPDALTHIPAGAAPIAFPVRSRNVTALQSYLHHRGIESGRLWPTWHATLPDEPHPIADFYRRSVLALPIHQELAASDIDRLSEAVDSAQRDGIR